MATLALVFFALVSIALTARFFLFAGLLIAAPRLFSRLIRTAVAASQPPAPPPPDSSLAAGVVPAICPQSEQNEIAPAIFLSHSGRQKPFVERLYDALVNAGHSVFFDRESIPRAVRLSPYIKRCARVCHIGVVVLSEDYVTTKWPMLELEIMTKTPSVEVFPLFYKLTLDELKDTRKLSKWRRQWKKIAANDKGIDVNEWENAVQSLHRWSGEVFPQDTTESLHIEKIVRAISKKIRPFISYAVYYVKARERLTEEIESRFNRAKQLCESSSRPCAIGLHGVGGLGKTTVCKLMVNFYQPEYAGRSELMEFPFMKDEKSILKECKKILRRFTTIDEALLRQVDHFDKLSH